MHNEGIWMPLAFAVAKTFKGSIPAVIKQSPSTATH